MIFLRENLYIVFVVFLSFAVLYAIFNEKREIFCAKKPISRIVSLSPSLTRQILDLDAENFLVGVSSFCPQLSKKIDVVSSVVTPDVERIFLLRPDCVIFMSDDVIANRARKIASLGIPIHSFNSVKSFNEICMRYVELASMIGKEDLAKKNISRYRESLSKINRAPSVRCAFFVSHAPPIVAGGKSFINEIIRDAGGINVFSDIAIGYPLVSMEQIAWQKPEILITMVPGGERMLRMQLAAMKANRFLWEYKIASVDDEHIPYYTPKDYCMSVKLFASILSSWKRAK
ncbi:MAG: helical backbone metal receptor [Spirochaetes bacterium]|nr:helical backbone metal receptor [Spirochaetota bacterium]